MLGVAVLSFFAPGPTAIDKTVSDLVHELPGLFGWFWEISYDLMIGWALLLLVFALFARGRKRLFLTELIAGALALGFAMLAGRIAGTDWSSSLAALAAKGTPPVYLAIRLAIATAVVVMASPHMSRPLRFIGRWVVTVGAVAGIALGVTLPIGMVAGLLIGLGSAAIMHLVLGSPAGRLTLDQIATRSAISGVGATDLRHAPLEPTGVALVLATSTDGHALLLKVYGRDAWDGQFLASIWSSLWRRGERPSLGFGRLQQVEHEAFVTLVRRASGRAGPPDRRRRHGEPARRAVGQRDHGTGFGSLDADEVDDHVVQGIWRAAAKLHELGIAHGQLDGDRIVVRADGDAGDRRLRRRPGRRHGRGDDGGSRADPGRRPRSSSVPIERSRRDVAAMGNESFAGVLPYLQPAVLDRDTRRAVRDGDWDLDELMTRSTAVTGTEAPELEQLRRVSGKSIAIVALIAFLAYGLISALANVGIESLWNELKSADMVWLVTALLLAPLSQMPQAFSTMGASVRDLLFAPS